MKVDDLLRRVAEGYEALLEVADAAGIRIHTISSGANESRVDFVTEDNVCFSINLAPIVTSPRPIEDALEAMRSAHDAAKQPQDMN